MHVPPGLLIAVILAAGPTVAGAGSGHDIIPAANVIPPSPRPVAWVIVAPPPRPSPPTPAPASHWFVSWLNATRAGYGLPGVAYDPNLEAWAAANNAQQASRGIGHHVMGPARRQNAAMAPAASIGPLWMASPGHRDALLDPTIRAIGLAGNGPWWTFNAY